MNKCRALGLMWFSGLALLCLLLSACDSSDDRNKGGDYDWPSESMFLYPSAWDIVISDNAPKAVKLAAADVAAYLKKMGLDTYAKSGNSVESCPSGMGKVVFLGDGVGEASFESATPTDQTWRIRETRCQSGVMIELMGGGLLGRQYAAYDWLHRIGVRFFHPEEEYVPDAPQWTAEAINIEHTPPFKYRSVSIHLTHPLELGDVFRYGKPEYADEARRYIDWTIKNLASDGQGGVTINSDSEEYAELQTYGFDRGFPRGAGITLYGQQQGGDGILDPNEENWKPILETEIDKRLGATAADCPTFFGFTFNPTEFTEADDQKVVEQMGFIVDRVKSKCPNTIVTTINHGTHGEPTAHYGVRYYDLPKFAPPGLAVKCHTLMFYDLFRPAPVYGNENFNFMYDFMASEYTKRELWHFPESAWWLTFDNQIPLYLPITIEARDRDIQGIAYMLSGKLIGHHTFGSGHEWGYWQNEYCSLRLANDIHYRYTDCLSDIVSPMGKASTEVKSVMMDLIAFEERDFIYGDILRYLVGSDPETEAAYSVGVVFHELPPSPAEILSWDEDLANDFDYRIKPQLQRMETDYMALLARMDAVAELVPEKGLPWFNEIHDGLEITALRARHQHQAYGAAVTFRRSQLERSADLANAAKDLLAAAKETTQTVLKVVAKREQGYRYKPIERSIGGGPEGKDDENWSTYPFRVHNRTHYAYYYTRIDDLVDAAMSATGTPVQVSDAVLAPGQKLVVDIIDSAVTAPSISFGDGQSVSDAHGEHTYAAAGVFTLSVTGQREAKPFAYSDKLASVESKHMTGFSGNPVEPAGTSIIKSVLPALSFGTLGATSVALGFSGTSTGEVKPGQWVQLDMAASAMEGSIETTPKKIAVPIVKHSDGQVLATMAVEGAKLTWLKDSTLATIQGMLETQGVIDAVIIVGGGAFDAEGARKMVASTLGYTVDELPASVPFKIEYTLETAAPAKK